MGNAVAIKFHALTLRPACQGCGHCLIVKCRFGMRQSDFSSIQCNSNDLRYGLSRSANRAVRQKLGDHTDQPNV
jgi:uncharacterized cysteine cluster protein YcgN (CxxCxxCC family)